MQSRCAWAEDAGKWWKKQCCQMPFGSAVCHGWGIVGGEGELVLPKIKPIKPNTCQVRAPLCQVPAKSPLAKSASFSNCLLPGVLFAFLRHLARCMPLSLPVCLCLDASLSSLLLSLTLSSSRLSPHTLSLPHTGLKSLICTQSDNWHVRQRYLHATNSWTFKLNL